MKILCFSDLHRDRGAARKLVELSRQVDLVIGAGDFATCRQGLDDTLEVLAQIELPAVLVPGNSESDSELAAACDRLWPSAHVLHGNGCTIEGVSFWGVGGGIPVTPFGEWSFDFGEDQARTMLAGCPGKAILVVHSPPLDTVDHDRGGTIRGSRAIRETVESLQPPLVVCGHIHNDWGRQTTLGHSRIVNAGPAGVLLDLDLPPSGSTEMTRR